MLNIKELVAKAQAGDYKAKYELGKCYCYGEIISFEELL
jgi:hypothetical protein